MTDNALKCKFNGGTIPYGYSIDDQQHYHINPVQAPLVLELFRRYAGGESMTDIVEDLNARGLRTTRGNRFNKNSLARIFSNRNYIGEYHHMGIVTPGGIPAIIPEELFERVAARLQQNKHAPGKAKAADPYLLTTKLFCGLCKTMMVGDSANKPNGVIYRYYKCAAAKRHQCDKKAVRKDWIEEKVLAFLISLLHDEETLDQIADEIIALLDKGNDMIPALQSQLKNVRSGMLMYSGHQKRHHPTGWCLFCRTGIESLLREKTAVQSTQLHHIEKSGAQRQEHGSFANGYEQCVQPEAAADIYGKLPAYQQGIPECGHKQTGKGKPFYSYSAGQIHTRRGKTGGETSQEKIQWQCPGKRQIEDQTADGKPRYGGRCKKCQHAQRLGCPKLDSPVGRAGNQKILQICQCRVQCADQSGVGQKAGALPHKNAPLRKKWAQIAP